MRILSLMRNTRKMMKLMKTLPDKEKDFNKVKDLIVVRPRPLEYIEGIRAIVGDDGRKAIDDTLYREEAPGVFSVMVYDFPSSRIGIHPDRLKDWGMTYDELFEHAMNNIRKLGKPEVGPVESPNEMFDFQALAAEDFEYMAAYASNLAEFPEMIGTRGALVGIPSNDIVLSLPINDEEPSAEVIAEAAEMMGLLASVSPMALSSKLYRWESGQYTVIAEGATTDAE